MSFWRIEEALHCQLMYSGVMFIQSGVPFKNCGMGPDWAVGSCLAGIYILVHVITVIAKVHIAISGFIAVTRRRTWNTCSFFRTNIYISASTSYMTSGTILSTFQKTLFVHSRLQWHHCIDIEEKPSISGTMFNFDPLCRPDIDTIFYSISDTISYCNIGI